MRRLSEPVLIALACAAIAIAASLLSVLALVSLQELSLTALIRMSSVEPIADLARSLEPNFQFVEADAHYDGVYYYAIAIDPLALGEAHQLIDLSAYRYSHVGYGWAAWVASLGRPENVPGALFALGILSIGSAAAIASIIARQLGWSPWSGLLVALNPGLLYAVSADTGEAFAIALLGLLFLAWKRGRWVWVGVLSAALCLTKEIFLVAAAGLVVGTLIGVWRDRERQWLQPIAAASIGPVVWVGWQIYLYGRFDQFALAGVPKSIYLPLQGWAESLTLAAAHSFSTRDTQQVGQIAVPLIVAVGALLLIGMYCSRRLRNEYEAVYLFLAALTLCLGPLQLVYPKDLLRLVSTPLVLLPAVLVNKRATRDERLRVEGHAFGERDQDRSL